MRRIAIAVAGLTVVAAAAAQTGVVVLPRPAFPPPAKEVEPTGAQLELESSRYHSPALTPPAPPDPPSWAPGLFRRNDLQLAIRQPGPTIFLVYGEPGHALRPGRILVAAHTRTRKVRYAFDFARFGWKRADGWFQHVQWAREISGVLYVENTHLTYASATRGRNAYITAVGTASGKILWRSPALVANARTFVVSGDLIVSGYGFTSEPDFLYLLDRRTGKVLDRLAVPSAPERIRLRGDRLLVRTYDADVVARIVR